MTRPPSAWNTNCMFVSTLFDSRGCRGVLPERRAWRSEERLQHLGDAPEHVLPGDGGAPELQRERQVRRSGGGCGQPTGEGSVHRHHGGELVEGGALRRDLHAAGGEAVGAEQEAQPPAAVRALRAWHPDASLRAQRRRSSQGASRGPRALGGGGAA